MKMDESVLEENAFYRLELSSYSKLDLGSFIVLLFLSPRKLNPWFVSWSFFLLRLLLKSTIRPCREYCCQVWSGAPSCYLEMLEKLQKRICRKKSLTSTLKKICYARSHILKIWLKAIQKYKNHPSIKMVKETLDSNKTFWFDFVSSDSIFKEISLDTKKGTHSNDVPTKIVKANADLFSVFVPNAFNESVISGKFLSVLKLADVKPVHKKKSRFEKTNYRPVSLLPNISKVFERCMHRQISEYFETVLSKFQCGFRKGYSTQD